MNHLTIVVPATIGALIAAVLELLKALGKVGEDDGGRWALVLSGLAGTVLLFLTQFGIVDLDSPEVAGVLTIIGLVAEIIVTFTGSFLTHKLAKAAKIFSQHRD